MGENSMPVLNWAESFTAVASSLGLDDFTFLLLICLFLLGALLSALFGVYYFRKGFVGYSSAIMAMPVPRQIVSSRGNVIFSNGACSKFFGRDDRSIPSILIERSRGQEDSSRKLFSLVQDAKKGIPSQIEIWVPSRQGAESGAGGIDAFNVRSQGENGRWCCVSTHPFHRRGGAVLWLVDDITVRRQMQMVIDDQQERLGDLLENAPIGFYSLDESGRFLFANQTLAKWLGYSSSELESGSVLLRDVVKDKLPDSIPAYHPFPDLMTNSGTATLRVKNREGKPQTIQVMISQDIANYDDARDSRVFRMRSVVRNLTLESEIQRALELSELRFRAFFDEAPFAIVLLDQSLVIKEGNHAFCDLFADSGKSDLKGRPLVDFFEGEHQETMRKLLAGQRQNKSVTDVILRDRAFSVQISALDSDLGQGRDYILNFVDMTEQRSLEAQFAQSQKMQAVGQLAGGIAHDFNNLLTAMIGFSDFLLMRHRPGDQSFADVMQIKQNANRAANLVRQLLAFSRQQSLQAERLNVTDILAELAHLLRRLMGESLELRIAHGRDLGDIRADQGQLEQVIINLAVNARDAMEKGGKLEIVTSNVSVEQAHSYKGEVIPAGDYVLIKVSDNGHGIPHNIMDRIFDPFFSTKEVGAGTGLGLSTVYGIVKQSQGFIFVDSGESKGTVFTLLFPHYCAGEEEQTEDRAKIEEETADLTGIGTILLVEDEDAVRSFSSRALQDKGYNVLEAASVEEAFKLVKENQGRLDLVISDVVMPHMDGPTMVRQLLKKCPDVKVLFISGYTEDAFRQSLRDKEDIDFLSKPFSLKQLAAKVKEVLGQ